MRYNKIFTLLSLSSILLSGTIAYAQGWRGIGGIGSGMETYLKRRLAPSVNIKNKDIKIIATSQGNTPKDIPEILKTKLVTNVQKDTNFKINDQRPETVLKFTVTALDIEFVEGFRKSGEQMIKYVLVNGNIEVSYQAIDARNNAPLDSENLTSVFKQDYPPSYENQSILGKILPGGGPSRSATLPPTRSELQNYLINDIVRQMAQRAAPSEEMFKVPLPRGKLDPISKIAMAQAWGKVLESAQTMATFPKPDDDSFRIYLLGLANEALAYEQTKDSNNYDQVKFDKTRSYLLEARKYYEEAKTIKPNEDKYIASWTRVDKALAQYDKITRQKNEYAQHIQKGQAQTVDTRAAGPSNDRKLEPAQKPQPAPVSSDVWDNQMIIKLWRDGTKEDELIEIVNSAESHRFDATSPNGYSELISAKVPPAVIKAMRTKAATIKRSPPRARTGSSKPKKP